MTRSVTWLRCALLMLVASCCAGSGLVAFAVPIDFENPPYTTGNIVGQDGWALTAYTGTPNGTLEVSTTNPMSGGGLQSLSYTRTELGLAGTFHDVVKSDVALVAKDGTPAADLKASYYISSTSLAGQGLGYGVDGVALSYAGPSGASPLGVRLNNAGSTIPSIEVFGNGPGGVGYYYFGGSLAAAAFPESDTLEFNIDVDFDSSTFRVS